MFVLIVAGITRGVPVRFQRCTESVRVFGSETTSEFTNVLSGVQCVRFHNFCPILNSLICHTVPRSRTQPVRLTPCFAATLDFDKLLLICKVQNMVGVRHEKRNQ